MGCFACKCFSKLCIDIHRVIMVWISKERWLLLFSIWCDFLLYLTEYPYVCTFFYICKYLIIVSRGKNITKMRLLLPSLASITRYMTEPIYQKLHSLLQNDEAFPMSKLWQILQYQERTQKPWKKNTPRKIRLFVWNLQ